jgi:hypothetical protein
MLHVMQGLVGCIYDAPYIFGARDNDGKHPRLHYTTWRAFAVFAAVGAAFDWGSFDIVPVDVLTNLLVENSHSRPPSAVMRCGSRSPRC